MIKRITTLALVLAFALAARPAGAQSLTGSVTGKVTDQQGAVLPGVTVTLTGKMGAKTIAALRRFQSDRGLPVSGKLDSATASALGK